MFPPCKSNPGYKRAVWRIYSSAFPNGGSRLMRRGVNRDRAPAIPSAQAGDIIGHRANFRIAHLRGNRLHHLVRVIPALAGAKRLELRLGVFGMLARETRI